jgi:ribosomal-protein-alanine N-acetyltransferase
MDNLNLFLAVNAVLETERLKLRPVTLADAEDMYEYASDDENTYYVFNTHGSVDDTRYSIANFFIANPLGKYGIELKDNQKLIGTIDLRVNMKRSSAEIGYVLNKKYFNKGYTTEAAQELLKFAFEILELEKVFATCNKENKASAAVMKKLGMTKEADLRHHERWKNGEWIDLLQYGILRDEYFGKPISS